MIQFYAFPPFCVIPSVANILQRQSKRCRSGTRLAKSTMVSTDTVIAKMLINYPVLVSVRKNLLSLPHRLPSRGTSTSKIETDYLRTIRSRFRRTGFSKQTTDIICSPWRTETQKRYACFVAKVAQVCTQQTHRSHTAVYK